MVDLPGMVDRMLRLMHRFHAFRMRMAGRINGTGQGGSHPKECAEKTPEHDSCVRFHRYASVTIPPSRADGADSLRTSSSTAQSGLSSNKSTFFGSMAKPRATAC